MKNNLWKQVLRRIYRGHGIEYFTITPTLRCQSRCRMCDIWKKGLKHPSRNEVSLDEYISFFEQVPNPERVSHINVTGGDPFLREDLDKLCINISKIFKNATIHIQTNGFARERIRKFVHTFFESRPNSSLAIGVSLDGDQKTHDYIRGTPGAYKAAIGTLYMLRELRDTHYKNLMLDIGSVLMPFNMYQQFEIQKLAQELKSMYSVYVLNFNLWLAPKKIPDNKFVFNEKTLEKARTVLQEISKREIRRRGSIYSPTSVWMSKQVEILGRKYHRRCQCGLISFCLDAGGNLYPCTNFIAKIGNIKNNSFSELWQGEKIKDFREKVLPTCHCNSGCESQAAVDTKPFSCLVDSLYLRFAPLKEISKL